jgi:hypothetical protein
MNWDGWTLNRVLVVFIGAAFLLIWVQVFLFHYRQNFHHKSMYVPVVVAPLLALSAVGLAFYKAPWLATVYTAVSVAGILSGLVGAYYHYKGVGVRVGGFEFRNFLIGPPVTLPIIFAALSVLGLFAIYW